jgi:hypothetical protein
MADLTSPRMIYAKGLLFLGGGLLASLLLLLEQPTIKVAALLGLAVWCFARFYYFAFYVIEHYVDPGYRFAGLWSFARYVWQHRSATPERAARGPSQLPGDAGPAASPEKRP